MFNLLTNWCQKSPCNQQPEQKYQVQVPPFFQIQTQLNQLPTFEKSYIRQNSPQRISKCSQATQTPPRKIEPMLKRVKSQPQCQININFPNEKENSYHIPYSNHKNQPFSSVHQSYSRPQVRILYENQQNHSLRQPQHQSPKGISQSYDCQSNYFPSGHSDPKRSTTQAGESDTTSQRQETVSKDDFNRILNINLNLIKLIEDDYRPIRSTVCHLEKQQQQRRQLLDVLEKKVNHLKGQMLGHR